MKPARELKTKFLKNLHMLEISVGRPTQYAAKNDVGFIRYQNSEQSE